MILSSLSLLLSLNIVSASVRNKDFPLGGPGRVIAVESLDNFCMFLPPRENGTIAESEGYPFAEPSVAALFAVSYCTKANSNAPGARIFRDGTITGAHFYKSDTQVSITGRLNPVAAKLVPTDGGGYYDLDNNVNSPPGGICAGYDSFYNFVGPVDGIFCIKCCKGIDACKIYDGEKGCSVMVPGDYTESFGNGGTPAPPPPTTSANPSNSSSTNATATASSSVKPSTSASTTGNQTKNGGESISVSMYGVSALVAVACLLSGGFSVFA